MKYIPSAILLCALAVSACRGTVHDQHEHEHAHEDEVAENANGVRFTEEQSLKFGLMTEDAALAYCPQIIKTVAEVRPSQGGAFSLTAQMSGIVNIDAGAVVNGERVVRGQHLFTIKSGGFADGNISVLYSQAESEYRASLEEYNRMTELSREKIVTQAQLTQAKNRYETARATYDNLVANFDASGQNVTAPADGFISAISISNGQYVASGETLATLTSGSSLQIVAGVQPRYYSCLDQISDAYFMTSGREYVSLKELGGKVLGYGKSLPEGGTLIPVTFQVPATDAFLPGSLVDVNILAGTPEEALTVPGGAIVEEMGSYSVYRQIAPEYYEKVQVTIGASDGRNVRILSGLEAGDRIVSRGAILLKAAQASVGLDAHAGHVH